MPNWCSNKVTIKGKRKDLISIQKKVKFDLNPFSCRNILPLESIPEGLDVAFYWGSKWDTNGTHLVNKIKEIIKSIDFIKGGYFEDLDEIIYIYSTAWSPISPVIAELARLYKGVYIIEEYSEESMGFRGLREYLNGETIREIQDLPLDTFDEQNYERIYNLETLKMANSNIGYKIDSADLFRNSIHSKHKYKPY